MTNGEPLRKEPVSKQAGAERARPLSDAEKPLIWYLDDITEHIDEFCKAHNDEFRTVPFEKPSRVLHELDSAAKYPDALLCDVFIYDNKEIASEHEGCVDKITKQLEDMQKQIGANESKNLGGIDAMEGVCRFFKDRGRKVPFPIYAYTTKAPYLLGEMGWDRITATDAKILLKGRITRKAEGARIQDDINDYHARIQRDINACRGRNSLCHRMLKASWSFLFESGIIGNVLGNLVTILLLSVFSAVLGGVFSLIGERLLHLL